MSEKMEKRKRANMRLKYIAMMTKWLDSEPPMIFFWKWRKWKKSRPFKSLKDVKQWGDAE